MRIRPLILRFVVIRVGMHSQILIEKHRQKQQGIASLYGGTGLHCSVSPEEVIVAVLKSVRQLIEACPFGSVDRAAQAQRRPSMDVFRCRNALGDQSVKVHQDLNTPGVC